MGLTEGMAKRAHEIVPLTPTPDSPSTPAQQPESPGLKEAESIMKPANNTGDIRGDIVRAKLPNGVELNTSRSGVEGELLGFLDHGSQEFRRVHFGRDLVCRRQQDAKVLITGTIEKSR